MFSAAEYWLVTKTLRREEKEIYICILYVNASFSNSIRQAGDTVYFTFNYSATCRPHNFQASEHKRCCYFLIKVFLTKVYISLCDEPGLVVWIQGESVGHQLGYCHSHSLHIYCLNAASHKFTNICDSWHSEPFHRDHIIILTLE